MMLRTRRSRRLAGALAALALVAAGASGCGGGGDERGATTPTVRTAPGGGPAPSGGSSAADVQVIRAWADTLRRGDVAGAAKLFALPAVVANGTRPLQLRTRRQVEAFNRSLPCGAQLTGTEPGAHGVIVATFRLTDRPGAGDCGTGAGTTAQTAFV